MSGFGKSGHIFPTDAEGPLSEEMGTSITSLKKEIKNYQAISLLYSKNLKENN